MKLRAYDAWAWAAIVANLLHYVALAALACLGVVALLFFLTFDSDHRAMRARLDHIVEVWTAPSGEAEKRLGTPPADKTGRQP